jgi:23S rRNA (adenine-N6)-dimethyltransferase
VAAGGPSRARVARPTGQHFLRSPRLAAELVDQVGVSRHDHVFEIGAGDGRLTRALAARAARVTAVEIDPELIPRLRRSFGGDPNVAVVAGDILTCPFPDRAFRAFGNIPFGLTTPILRRLLDDPEGPLARADLLVQYEAARKRASVWPTTLVSLGWHPWWEPSLSRHISRLAFDPPPSVDAGLLSITRRDPPLLGPSNRESFVRLLGRAFRHASQPVRRSLRDVVPPRTWKRLARDRGIAIDATPTQLDAYDWVAIFTGEAG